MTTFGEIDWINLAECCLFLRKVKRNIVTDENRVQEDGESILDIFLSIYKSGTAYAIK